MTDLQLLDALRRLKVETGSLACSGCGHEHNCTTKGCKLIREAIDRLSQQRWRSTKNDPPKEYGPHLVCYVLDGIIETVGIAGYNTRRKMFCLRSDDDVRVDPDFWMSIDYSLEV